MKKSLLLFLTCLVFSPLNTFAAVEFSNYSKFEFSPQRGEKFDIPIKLTQKATVYIAIYTSDGDLVQTLGSAKKSLNPGIHKFSWNGKDENGIIVPDEAYVPVINYTLENGKKGAVNDGTASGGEVVENIKVHISPDKHISYNLPSPSRVLIRVGIKGGPMLRSLAVWEPRGPGKNIQHWNGKDQDGLMDIRENKGLSIFVAAYKLPDYSIITTGNNKIDYRTYRKNKGWEEPKTNFDKMVLARGNVRISRNHYLPKSHNVIPQVNITLPDNLPRSKNNLPVIKEGQTVAVRADIAKQDRWLMKQSLYEVAFFVDNVFVAEEEQGYVPLTWRWKVQSLKKGRHILTVNISGFDGKTGVSSLLFEVLE